MVPSVFPFQPSLVISFKGIPTFQEKPLSCGFPVREPPGSFPHSLLSPSKKGDTPSPSSLARPGCRAGKGAQCLTKGSGLTAKRSPRSIHSYGCGSRPRTPGEHQNRWQMDVPEWARVKCKNKNLLKKMGQTCWRDWQSPKIRSWVGAPPPPQET